jgi:hypothetical protein
MSHYRMAYACLATKYVIGDHDPFYHSWSSRSIAGVPTILYDLDLWSLLVAVSSLSYLLILSRSLCWPCHREREMRRHHSTER